METISIQHSVSYKSGDQLQSLNHKLSDIATKVISANGIL